MTSHAGQPIEWGGAPLGEGRGVVIAVHGRNASPASILSLTRRFERPTLTYAAPAAANHSWYPHTFLAPVTENEPAISSALGVLEGLMHTVTASGIPKDRVVLMGFSQGACLSAEFAVRHPDRYGGVLVLSGGLMGPPGTSWNPTGSLDRTPVFLGCSDVDVHIPRTRVEESRDIFTRMDAGVTCRLYPDMGHTVNDDEVAFARALFDRWS